MKNICDSQNKTGASEAKNRVAENSVFDLAGVTTGRKIVSELTCEEKYYYLTKHHCPKDQNSLLKKQCIKGGQNKNLPHLLSWIQSKQWHVYSKQLQDGLCKVCVLLDRNSGSKPRSKSLKTAFQDVGKSDKITKHETKKSYKDVLEKAKDFLESYEDPTKSITHDKNSDEKCKRNIHIIKIIIRAVLLCTEQQIALRGHREQDSSNDARKNSDTERAIQRGNFLAIIINAFATLDAVLMETLEKGPKNAKMVSWPIQNDIIECLSEFLQSKIKDEIPDYNAIIADEVTDRFSNKEILHFVNVMQDFVQMKNLISAKNVLILYTSKVDQQTEY